MLSRPAVFRGHRQLVRDAADTIATRLLRRDGSEWAGRIFPFAVCGDQKSSSGAGARVANYRSAMPDGPDRQSGHRERLIDGAGPTPYDGKRGPRGIRTSSGMLRWKRSGGREQSGRNPRLPASPSWRPPPLRPKPLLAPKVSGLMTSTETLDPILPQSPRVSTQSARPLSTSLPSGWRTRGAAEKEPWRPTFCGMKRKS